MNPLYASPSSPCSPRRTDLLLPAQTPDSPPDFFSNLPVELISEIFQLAYPSFAPKPSAPLSKCLLPFFLERLYFFTQVKDYGALERLCAAVKSNPSHGALVRDLSIELAFVAKRGRTRPSAHEEEMEWPASLIEEDVAFLSAVLPRPRSSA